MGILGTLFLIFFVIPFLWGVLKGVIGAVFELFIELISEFGLFYILFFLIFLPFRILNWLQTFLHKPWRVFQKFPPASESAKDFWSALDMIARVPLYFACTPVRLANAVAFNLVLRPLYEFWNYIAEVFVPSDYDEGDKNFGEWLLYLPYRILKYPVYHGVLTIVECLLFTVYDTIFPTVTLYHGTSSQAADAIVQSPTRTPFNREVAKRTDGVWNVGGGNYAGDGIYFAPRISTAMHYARSNWHPVVIICRVSLGSLLPLSLSPGYVYNSAGLPNAHAVTSYGLKNGYDSIEWWRKDRKWWEYCLLDWKNKYNESWRIRPIMILNPRSFFFSRINGGSRHWFFDRMILNDIKTTLSN